jgi:hypothetical protein
MHFHLPHNGNALLLSGISAVLAGAIGSAASIAGGPAVSEYEISWIVRIAFGALLALNGYFIRQAAKEFRSSQSQIKENTRDIHDLQEISEIVLTNMLVESAGDPSIGRRKNDAILRIMLAKVTARRFLSSKSDDNSNEV